MRRESRDGRPSSRRCPFSTPDFAVWQRGALAGDRLARELAFWRSTLDGVPVIELPTDRPRPSAQAFRGASLPVALAPASASRVRQTARALDATPFMTMLAVYAALLHRWTGQADFAIGSPVANRTRPDIEGLIGFFANTVVLRVRLDGQPTFRELVARVGGRPSTRSRTRSCPSSAWSRSCSRSARSATTRFSR